MSAHTTFSLSQHGSILVVTAAGVASNQPEGRAIYRKLMQALEDALQATPSEALVFDFTSLTYEWGDQMAELLGRWNVPFAVVTSPLNAKGLSSLVCSELFFEDPKEVLFASLDQAFAAVGARNGSASAT